MVGGGGTGGWGREYLGGGGGGVDSPAVVKELVELLFLAGNGGGPGADVTTKVEVGNEEARNESGLGGRAGVLDDADDDDGKMVEWGRPDEVCN
jgi:hypothetical protein